MATEDLKDPIVEVNVEWESHHRAHSGKNVVDLRMVAAMHGGNSMHVCAFIGSEWVNLSPLDGSSPSTLIERWMAVKRAS
jgi:hypothetical protein